MELWKRSIANKIAFKWSEEKVNIISARIESAQIDELRIIAILRDHSRIISTIITIIVITLKEKMITLCKPDIYFYAQILVYIHLGVYRVVSLLNEIERVNYGCAFSYFGFCFIRLCHKSTLECNYEKI